MIGLAMMLAAAASDTMATLGTGRPDVAAAMLKATRACKIPASLRPWKDGDVVPAPPAEVDKRGWQTVIPDAPIERADQRMQCYLKKSAKALAAITRSGR